MEDGVAGEADMSGSQFDELIGYRFRSVNVG
jgi:hypothetical protein